MASLQEALVEALGRKPSPVKEEQAAVTVKPPAEPLTTQQRVAKAIVDGRRNVSNK
jgi:hypothetical protein